MNQELRMKREHFSFDARFGFTLVELLVTMAIAGVLFAGGYAAYQDFARRQTLDNAYKELRTNLTLARQLAVSGEKLSSCTSPLSGYRVDFYSTRYTLSAVCGTTTVVNDIPLPSGITVSGLSGFTYKALAQGTSLDSSVTLVLTQESTNSSINATLSKEGILER